MRPNIPDKQPITPADIQTILEIGAKRKALLYQLREAIITCDVDAERRIARELAGLPQEVTKQ